MFVVNDGCLTRRERFLLQKLQREYTNELFVSVLLPFLNQTSPISLRALDWAVVNWSKKYNVICSSAFPGRMTNIHQAYRKTLTYWKRRLFDPFRRRARIVVRIEEREYETTLGQANFTLWAYRTGVLSYVLGHIESIETDMNEVSRRSKRSKSEAARSGLPRRREELTKSPRAVCFAYNNPSRVKFQ